MRNQHYLFVFTYLPVYPNAIDFKFYSGVHLQCTAPLFQEFLIPLIFISVHHGHTPLSRLQHVGVNLKILFEVNL